MEIRDLYDENKVLTGETVEKGQQIPAGRYYLTVVVFIQNSEKEFLLQINKKYDMWTTTGGHPTTGQTSLVGIVAEIKEELGIDVDSSYLKLFKTIKSEDDFVELYYMSMDIDLADIVVQEEEVGKIKWASIAEVNDLIKNDKFLPPHIDFFYDCLDYLNG